jgi:drug/metabolite transporter (DMT)-like permease
LLLSLEAVATAVMAWLIFRENLNIRVALGMALLVAGALVLAWSGTPAVGNVIGPLAIVGACVAWGLDNNLTRKVSHSDPLQIVEIKGLVAGPVNLALAFWAGGSMPAMSTSLIAMAVGFVGYGLSIVLFVLALRHLGAARTGAYFSLAPFAGAVLAVLMLGEPLSAKLMVAGGLMALGLWLHLAERHEHEHAHEAMEHEHRHVHDEHHRHEHGADAPQGEPHSHWHRHEPMVHRHPHYPDLHHRHRHGNAH